MKNKIRIVAMGVFDGVHQGHRYIFKKAIAKAASLNGIAVAYTFDPHPIRVLAPQACPESFMINTLPQRKRLLKEVGIDQVIVEKFTKKFSKQTPQDFVKNIVVKKLKPTEIFVGYNFTFGIKRSGTAEDLQKLCKPFGIKVNIVAPFNTEQTITSSTQVRQFLSRGDMPRAQKLLHRPYFLEGKVVRGRGVGNKVLGIPTANLKSENEILLPNGVYATQTVVSGKKHSSITNMGHNPTFVKKGFKTIETHIFHFHKNIVGQKIRVYFLRKLRDEKKFNSPQELTRQIHEDIRKAQKIR